MPNPTFDAEKAAKMLAEASLFGDAKAAEKYKITPRTLRNYRKRLSEDADFSLIFAKHLAVFLGHDEGGKELEVAEAQIALRHWINEMEGTLSQMVGETRALWLELKGDAKSFTQKMQVFQAALGFMSQLGEPLMVKEVLNGSSDGTSEGESVSAPSEGRSSSTATTLN